MEPTTTIQLLRTIVKSLNQHELCQLENLVVEYRTGEDKYAPEDCKLCPDCNKTIIWDWWARCDPCDFVEMEAEE